MCCSGSRRRPHERGHVDAGLAKIRSTADTSDGTNEHLAGALCDGTATLRAAGCATNVPPPSLLARGGVDHGFDLPQHRSCRRCKQGRQVVEQLSGLVRGRMRRMVAFAAAPVLVTAVGVSAWSPSAVAEAPVSVGADTVVSGVVTRDGVPVSEAEIVATAWPEQAVLDKLAAGDPVPTQVLGTVRSDKSGRFALPLRPGTLGPDYTGPDGE